MTILKAFCEDILLKLYELGTGDCSLKGFVMQKLYTIRKQIKEQGNESCETVMV